MSEWKSKTVSIKVRIAAAPEDRHPEVMALIERFNLRKFLEYLMETQHNKTMLNGIQDAELVVSLEDRDECRGRTFPIGKQLSGCGFHCRWNSAHFNAGNS